FLAALRHAERGATQAKTEAIELVLCDREALTLRAQQVVGWHDNVLKPHLLLRTPLPRDHWDVARFRETRRVVVHQEHADALGALACVGHGRHGGVRREMVTCAP